MMWFENGIASAINLAKARNAIFVVYCEGKDDNSKLMTNMINTESISSKLQSDTFVAVKIESDKEEYLQFCKIFQLVPVPSIFFIKNSIPIKIITSAVKSAAEMEEAIDNIIKQETGSVAGSTTSFLEMEKRAEASNKDDASKSSEIVCEGDVCSKKTTSENVENKPESEPVEKVETEEEKQEKIKRAMKLIEEKRIERIKEEQRLEKERELKRRQEGKEIQNLKKWQDDQELQQIKDERKREKEEAMAARQRVLDQIEQDKKDRAQRFNQASQPQESVPVKQPEPSTTPTTPPNSTKIQFKRPDGTSEIVTFDSSMKFEDLHAFVASDILNGTNIKEFKLATTFPRYEFTELDFPKTLLELQLVPSSVILIISSSKSSKPSTSVLPTASEGSFFDMIGALIFGLFSPVFALFTYMKNFVMGYVGGSDSVNEGGDAGKRKRNEDILAPNDAAKRRNLSAFLNEPSTSQESSTGAIPKSSAYKRTPPASNIHRLHEDSDSDDEERKTYNGNSTQQM